MPIVSPLEAVCARFARARDWQRVNRVMYCWVKLLTSREEWWKWFVGLASTPPHVARLPVFLAENDAERRLTEGEQQVYAARWVRAFIYTQERLSTTLTGGAPHEGRLPGCGEERAFKPFEDRLFFSNSPAIALRLQKSVNVLTQGIQKQFGPAVFRRRGDKWEILFHGELATVRDSLGIRYIAHLLAHPGEKIRPLDLVDVVAGRVPAARALETTGEAVVDDKWKESIQEKLQDLQKELAEAERNQDIGRIADLKEQRQQVQNAAAADLGLGGKARRMVDDAERARVSVTKRIRDALKQIAKASPRLGRYLREPIVNTGSFCSFLPDPGDSVWSVETDA